MGGVGLLFPRKPSRSWIAGKGLKREKRFRVFLQAYSLFNMPQMYSLLIVLFVIAIGANALIGRFGGLNDIKRL